MLDIVLLMCRLQFVFESLLSVLLSGKNTVVLQEFLLKVIGLNLFQVEVRF